MSILKLINYRFWGWLLLVSGLSGFVRYRAFNQTPYANGWDSYFYLIQVKAWVNTGHMHSPEASLIYPLMRAVLWCTEGDYIGMYKWTAALLAAAFSALVLLLNQQKGSRPMALLVAALLLFSPHLTYFAAQYPKNLLGIVLLLAFVHSLRYFKFEKNQPRWYSVFQVVMPCIWLIINYFGHRLTFGLCLLYGMVWAMFKTGHLKSVLTFKNTILAVSGLATVLVLLSYIAPGLLHLTDMARLQGVFSTRPQFAPWSFVQSFGWERLTAPWLLEIGATVVVLAMRSDGSAESKVWKIVAVVLLFPFLTWSLTGLAYRLFLVFGLLLPILVMQVRWNVVAIWLQVPVATMLLISTLWGIKGYQPALHDPNYAQFDHITQQVQQNTDFSAVADTGTVLVIAHNALAEYFTFTTNIDAMPWLPEYTLPASNLWRIVADMNPQELRYFLHAADSTQVPVIQALGARYCLLREDHWQLIVQQARIEGDTALLTRAADWRNPSKQRPAYLLRRKNKN
jgi:hypothetical protein